MYSSVPGALIWILEKGKEKTGAQGSHVGDKELRNKSGLLTSMLHALSADRHCLIRFPSLLSLLLPPPLLFFLPSIFFFIHSSITHSRNHTSPRLSPPGYQLPDANPPNSQLRSANISWAASMYLALYKPWGSHD